MCFLLWIAASCMYLEIRATFGQSYDAMLKSCYLLLHCVGGVMLQVWRLWSNLWIPSSSHSDFWMHHLQTLNHHKHLMLPNVCMWYIVLVLGQLTLYGSLVIQKWRRLHGRKYGYVVRKFRWDNLWAPQQNFPFLALRLKEAPSASFTKVVHRVSLGHMSFWLAWWVCVFGSGVGRGSLFIFFCMFWQPHACGVVICLGDNNHWPWNVIYFHMCYFKVLIFVLVSNKWDLIFGLTCFLRLIVVTPRAHTTQRVRDSWHFQLHKPFDCWIS